MSAVLARYVVLSFMILLICFCLPHAKAADNVPPLTREAWVDAFDELKDRLKKEGVPSQELKPFQVPPAKYVGRAVEAKMMSIVRPRQRKPLFNKKTPNKAIAFMAKHRTAFDRALKEDNTPPEIISAILWIETHYTSYRPRFPALGTIASLAALSVPAFGDFAALRIQELAKQESLDRKTDNGWKSVDWIDRARDIGDSYYEELKAYLFLAHRLKWKATKMKGSWAGALGKSQFLPTTAKRNMRLDGETPLTNLWGWNDTIQLTARHLSENGWTAGATIEQQRAAIYGYNKVNWYVDAVLELAGKIREKMAAPP